MSVDLTPYESFISLPFVVQLLVMCVPLTAVTIVLTIRTRRLGGESRMNDNVSTAIIRFAGAAFVFLGAFAIVTAWQSSTSITNDVSREFAAVSSIDQDTGALDVLATHALRTRGRSCPNPSCGHCCSWGFSWSLSQRCIPVDLVE